MHCPWQRKPEAATQTTAIDAMGMMHLLLVNIEEEVLESGEEP